MILYGIYAKPSDVDLIIWMEANFPTLAEYAWQGATS